MTRHGVAAVAASNERRVASSVSGNNMAAVTIDVVNNQIIVGKSSAARRNRRRRHQNGGNVGGENRNQQLNKRSMAASWRVISWQLSYQQWRSINGIAYHMKKRKRNIVAWHGGISVSWRWRGAYRDKA